MCCSRGPRPQSGHAAVAPSRKIGLAESFALSVATGPAPKWSMQLLPPTPRQRKKLQQKCLRIDALRGDMIRQQEVPLQTLGQTGLTKPTPTPSRTSAFKKSARSLSASWPRSLQTKQPHHWNQQLRTKTRRARRSRTKLKPWRKPSREPETPKMIWHRNWRRNWRQQRQSLNRQSLKASELGISSPDSASPGKYSRGGVGETGACAYVFG